MSLSNADLAKKGFWNARYWYEWLIEKLIYIAGGFSIAIIVLIFVFLLRDSLPFFTTYHYSLREILFGATWSPTADKFGGAPLIAGTLVVTALAIAIALPLGVIAAVYVGAIAPVRVREILKPVIELIAAIPSVVVGFIGLALIGPALFRFSQGHGNILQMSSSMSALAAGIMLAFMALPTIVSVAEDAIRAVPRDYQEGALALGATRLETLVRITLPASLSGIVAAVMLGVGRAIGETMVVLMVAGNSPQIPEGWWGIFQPVRTMTAAIAAEAGETAQGGAHYSALFVIGLFLFLITFGVNFTADRLVRRKGGK